MWTVFPLSVPYVDLHSLETTPKCLAQQDPDQWGLRHCHKSQIEITEAWVLRCKTACIVNKPLGSSVSWHTNYSVWMPWFNKSLYGLKLYSKTSSLATMCAHVKHAQQSTTLARTTGPLVHFRITNELNFPHHASFPGAVGKDYAVERTYPG